MLNTRSRHLVVLVATYNRLGFLWRSLDSIRSGTKPCHEIIVIDGGSTDGTVEYLESQRTFEAVFQGKRVGTSRCYNEVWRQIDCRFTCWLSDGTGLAPGSLDLALRIVEEWPSVGIVGLKMKDAVGPWRAQSYVGGVSEYGVLTCNHGVLSLDLLRSVGYFDEDCRSYTIDADLTTSVLCAGRDVVMTKEVSVLHHRHWAEFGEKEKMQGDQEGIDNPSVYRSKFGFLSKTRRFFAPPFLKKLVLTFHPGVNARDRYNLTRGRVTRLRDPIGNRYNPFHLVQRIPRRFLLDEGNPYRTLVPPA